MKKYFLQLLLGVIISAPVCAQISVSKMLGKDSKNYPIGYGFFVFFDIPLNAENQSIRIEAVDLVFFPGIMDGYSKGYVSIRGGYKYIFSETKTGFYILPTVGYCRVAKEDPYTPATKADGIAAALEGGYSLEVGQGGNAFTFGVKYEMDRGDREHIISSIGLRLAFSFNLFGRRN